MIYIYKIPKIFIVCYQYNILSNIKNYKPCIKKKDDTRYAKVLLCEKIIFTDTSKMVKFLMKNIKNKNILNHQLILRYSTINIIFYIITLKKSNIKIIYYYCIKRRNLQKSVRYSSS